MAVSVVTLGFVIFENKSYSQNILGLKVAPSLGDLRSRPEDSWLTTTWWQPNVLETLNDRELLKRCRMDREGIEVVVELVSDTITFPTNWNNPIMLELKCNSGVNVIYPVFGYGENAALQHRLFRDISAIRKQLYLPLCRPHIICQFIQFPLDDHQQQRIEAKFMEIAGIPGVIGAIDGTHTKIITPSQGEDVFVSRTKFHSINTQIVFDTRYNILDIVMKWPGSTHDSWSLIESGLTQLFQQMPLLLTIHVFLSNLPICNFCPKRFCLRGGTN